MKMSKEAFDEMNKEGDRTMNEGERLAKEHWKWLSKVLERIYIDAFIHGYKHAKEIEK